jgi:hypothetical protein
MLSKTVSFQWLPATCIAAIFLSSYQAAAGSKIDELLKQTGRTVELFWQKADSYTCTELVTQEKLGKKDKIEYKTDSTFDYLALTKTQEDGLTIEELRLQKKKSAAKHKKPSLLATNGFPTLLLIFHPHYQANYRFQIETDAGDGGNLTRVHFEQIPGMQSTCALMLKDRIYPLELKGTAWIDGDTGIIQKMSASLISPLKDINIKSFDAEVVYKPQKFSSDPKARWLPSTAVINIQTALQHWRNIHLYSQYKRFSVQSVEEGQARIGELVHPQAK